MQTLCVYIYIYFPWDHIIWHIDIYSPTKITYANDTDLCLWKWATRLHHQIMATLMGKMWFIHREMMMGDVQWPPVIYRKTSLCLAGPLFFATWGWIPIKIKFIITLGFWKYMNSSFCLFLVLVGPRFGKQMTGAVCLIMRYPKIGFKSHNMDMKISVCWDQSSYTYIR